MILNNVSFKYDKEIFIDSLNLKFKQGEITSIIGANGSGKTTLLSLISKNLKLINGEIILNGKNINDFNFKEFAKKLAMLHQINTAPDDISVRQIISYGRIAHRKLFKDTKEKDDKVINNALSITDLENLSSKKISELSGGEKQRVFLAMALAQETSILLLDEPTSFLDIKYQVKILDIVRKINKEKNITIVMILHDINQAIKYSENIIAMKKGKIIANGKADTVLTESVLEKIYDTKLNIGYINGRKIIYI